MTSLRSLLFHPQRTAICFPSQFNGAQANSYLVLTQTAGSQVIIRGVAVGNLITDGAVPLLLKPGGDVSCSQGTLQTLTTGGTFDLSQVSVPGTGGLGCVS